MPKHPLDPLSAAEFRQVAAALRRDSGVTERYRFASIELEEPPKAEVQAWQAGDPVLAERSPCSGTAPTTAPTRRSST